MTTKPDLAIEKYRCHAAAYDRRTVLGQPVRRRAVARLRLCPGDAVVDVACGTGLNFPPIQESIGETGRLIGIDLSPDMLAEAEARVARHGWRNVTLIQSPAEEATMPDQVDAVLFSFAHDVLQSPQAIENVLSHVKPRGRVSAAGMNWAPWWMGPVNFYVWYEARNWITTFEGFDRPWRHLARFVPDLQVEWLLFGVTFVAWGAAGG